MLSCLIRITNSRIHLLVSSITQHCNCVTIYPAWPIVSRNCCDFNTPTPLSFIQSTYSVGSHNCCYLFVSYLQNIHTFPPYHEIKEMTCSLFSCPFHTASPNEKPSLLFYFSSPHSLFLCPVGVTLMTKCPRWPGSIDPTSSLPVRTSGPWTPE